MIATVSLILWVAGLYVMLKYRVHIHITRDERLPRQQAPRMAKPEPVPEPAGMNDIVSALVGLGCDKQKARTIARKVCAGSADFNQQLREAIREAA